VAFEGELRHSFRTTGFPHNVNVSKLLAAALGLLVLIAAVALLVRGRGDARSAGPVSLAAVPPPARAFSRAASTGLFVGVRTFADEETLPVPYAADDAVDLAYRFTLDARVGLVPPRRAILALSGAPRKEESKKRLGELKDAGAQIVYAATSDDIRRFLKQQAKRAGDDGLLVVSIASHGFQQDGDSYILGSSSTFESPESSLRLATVLDVAAQVPRSLLFIDACRERLQISRGGTPDPAAAAPHVRGMKNVQGQVIFYAAAAGEYAFDDPVHQNGVFTKAVLDGLDCEASAPRQTVLAETLHAYVDREVRRWIRDNKNRDVNPATQVSMEGETRNMPLSSCWRCAGNCVRISVHESVITAYDPNTRPLWQKDFGEPILHAEAVDLDADSFCEVVVGLRDRLSVFEIDGKQRWNHPAGDMNLRTFTTGDLFEKHTKEIVSLWSDGRTSRMVVTRRDGHERSRFDYPGLLERVTVDRPTKMHAPRIVAATPRDVMVVDTKKLKPLWHFTLEPKNVDIRDLRILDADYDRRRDIAVTAGKATTWFTFDGKMLRQSGIVDWQKETKRRRR
jgi:hypothetical protein